jgi:hypothetical protein
VDLLGAVGKATVYDLHWSSMGPLDELGVPPDAIWVDDRSVW